MAKGEDAATGFAAIRRLVITELSKHKKQKSTLLAPYHALQDRLQFSSWKDDFLPLYSWGALAVSLWN